MKYTIYVSLNSILSNREHIDKSLSMDNVYVHHKITCERVPSIVDFSKIEIIDEARLYYNKTVHRGQYKMGGGQRYVDVIFYNLSYTKSETYDESICRHYLASKEALAPDIIGYATYSGKMNIGKYSLETNEPNVLVVDADRVDDSFNILEDIKETYLRIIECILRLMWNLDIYFENINYVDLLIDEDVVYIKDYTHSLTLNKDKVIEYLDNYDNEEYEDEDDIFKVITNGPSIITDNFIRELWKYDKRGIVNETLTKSNTWSNIYWKIYQEKRRVPKVDEIMKKVREILK